MYEPFNNNSSRHAKWMHDYHDTYLPRWVDLRSLREIISLWTHHKRLREKKCYFENEGAAPVGRSPSLALICYFLHAAWNVWMSSLGVAVSLTMAVLTTWICSAFPPSESCACLYVMCDCQCVGCAGGMVQNHLQTVAYKLLCRTCCVKWEWIRASKMRKQQTKSL